jgi:hypothetical protein
MLLNDKVVFSIYIIYLKYELYFSPSWSRAVTQIHHIVIQLSATLNQSTHWMEQMPSDLWLCIKHPSHQEQRSSIIMHVHRMIDCPGHNDSYIKQQLATRWEQPLPISDTNHFVLCWLPSTSSRSSVSKTLNLNPTWHTKKEHNMPLTHHHTK